MAKETDILRLFGSRVREKRKELGYSQEAFADHCGLDRTYVSGIERGNRNIGLRNVQVVCKALGVKVSELMHGL